MKKKKFITLAISLLVLSACAQEEEAAPSTEQPNQTETQPTEDTTETSLAASEFFEPFDGKIDHLHGMGYVGNQASPFFATHDGLKVYENGKWLKTKKENNDYMGFNATNDGFYSSGHPGSDSKLPNPIGIVKSVDNGQTLQSLGFEREVDFHLMAVGYSNHMIFAKSPHENSKLKGDAFYISEDDGATWKEVAAEGLTGKLVGIAVHPTDKNLLAAAGEEGIYLSNDRGETFDLITKGSQGTSVFFVEDSLLYGTYDGQPLLKRRNLTNQEEGEIPLPEMKQDAVMYMASNPKDEQEITFVSFNTDIYQTKNNGENWSLLVKSKILQ